MKEVKEKRAEVNAMVRELIGSIWHHWLELAKSPFVQRVCSRSNGNVSKDVYQIFS